jgi:hypothetical protein
MQKAADRAPTAIKGDFDKALAADSEESLAAFERVDRFTRDNCGFSIAP